VPWFPLYASAAGRDAVPEIQVERRADGTVVSVTNGASGAPGAGKLRGYLLDLSQSRNPARRLTLDWDPAVTGFQEVLVEASHDLQHWEIWSRSAQLARLDYNGQRIERRDIDLPGRHAAYVRLTWRDPDIAPPLTAAAVIATADRPAPLVWSAALAPSVSSADAYEWRFPAPLAPERARISLPQANVLAPAELWGESDDQAAGPGRLRARTVLYRLEVQGRVWESDDIALAGPPLRAIKLKLDARGGGLGGAPMLALGLAARQVLFLARGAGPFVLAIGDASAEPAALPPATLIPGYGGAGAPPISPAALGAIATPALAAPSSAAPALAFDWKTATLWAILLAGIAGIAAMALYLLRQMRK
jgi:hypothetical protein